MDVMGSAWCKVTYDALATVMLVVGLTMVGNQRLGSSNCMTVSLSCSSCGGSNMHMGMRNASHGWWSCVDGRESCSAHCLVSGDCRSGCSVCRAAGYRASGCGVSRKGGSTQAWLPTLMVSGDSFMKLVSRLVCSSTTAITAAIVVMLRVVVS
jgi:hypothetical protein